MDGGDIPVDIFRIMPLRLLGYSIGLAEAARYRLTTRKVVLIQEFGIAVMICHVLHSGITQKSILFTLNSICFEAICSFWIPPLFIKYICRKTAWIMIEREETEPFLRRWGPTLTGLLTIPVLMKTVDVAVDTFLGNVLSPTGDLVKFFVKE